ncbi:Hypothetical Protein FCC1311_036392 [Hondaea fermentalgiana]|uniref:N-formylglutamate amidohydrolase n=1 Tax=Hondaea fermentalgiana TaxID=2315210 RepID=A0A2R5GCH4_9STRA|nr:Hypothetical Protein FCC1311_036392 [Hondaea fermentalgiana]|eukprot:GBG27418.1 Hypothetical Protein FCC1311_036392 [Hondaea fermentalgiana]
MTPARRLATSAARRGSRSASTSAAPKTREGPNFKTVIPHQAKGPANFLVTCEHAANGLPAEIAWGAADESRGLSTQHWAYDPGALDLAVELADALQAPLVHSLYSRLFVDVNRPVSSSTLARTLCDQQAVELNRDVQVSPQALEERIRRYYLPYHGEIERVAQETGAKTAISVHTFTPNYEGSVRDFEIGVLYSTSNQTLVEMMTDAFNASGFSAKVNEPWSGRHGFMFSVDCFTYNASPPGTRDAIMLEIRNDKCQDAAWRARFLEAMLPFLTKAEEKGSAPSPRL